MKTWQERTMKYRMALVKAMDDFMQCAVNDEDYIEPWLMVGCPDGSTEEDYEWFAESDTELADLIELFAKYAVRDLRQNGTEEEDE